MSEAIFLAVLALVCAFSSGFLLCQYLSGWTGEDENQKIQRLIDELPPVSTYRDVVEQAWMPGRVVEK